MLQAIGDIVFSPSGLLIIATLLTGAGIAVLFREWKRIPLVSLIATYLSVIVVLVYLSFFALGIHGNVAIAVIIASYAAIQLALLLSKLRKRHKENAKSETRP